MAFSIRNADESKRMRKMSLSYIKDSIVRRSGRQNGPRSHVCCCEILEDANGENAVRTNNCSKDISASVEIEKCKCDGRPLADKHKVGIFKTLKKRFQLSSSVPSDSVKYKAQQTFRAVESSGDSYSSFKEDSSEQKIVGRSTRKSKGFRSICPMSPPLHLLRSTGNGGKSSPLSLKARFSRKENVPPSMKGTDGHNISSYNSLTLPSKSAQGELRSSNNAADVNKDLLARRLSRSLNDCDADDDDYSEAHNFVVNLEGNEVQYEPCAVVRNSNEDGMPMPSPSKSLTCELFNLAKQGWYWGPISREEAEEKLLDLPDGAFLVRDSSADRYLLSVSFRSSGRTFHTRIEYSFGLFSLYSTPGRGGFGEGEGFSSIVELINHSMAYSESAVFCYSRPRELGYPGFPVRLVRPVSRFTQVRSLQYLCRFVIRQYTRVDNIQKLPLPNRLKGYIQEGHY